MKIKTGQGNMTLQKLIAIYSISMVTSLPGLAISPILGKLESIFSSTSELQLQMLESLPSFIIVPFILLAGRMSLYFNTKKLLITGLAIFFACSIAYPFADRMWALLLISGLLGIGAGLVIPFSTGLVADYFSGSYRTKQLGYVSAITNLTLVIATLLAGFLAGISWHLSFVVYCISGISLFFAFYLDEKPPFYSASAQEATPVQQPATHHHKKYNWLIKLMLFYYVATFLALTIPLNLSLYMHNLKLGNYDISGTLISVFFLSMTLPGLLINRIIDNRKRGKRHHIIINAEGIGHSASMAKRIEAATGIETRATILGYMQRGGAPTCKDRVYASIMGAKAVELLEEGKTNRVVAYKHGEFLDFDIQEALNMKKDIPEDQYEISKLLIR